jgi:Flagellar hook-length control protein FliK
VIACVPQIVISPTPTPGPTASATAGPSSGDPFSAALQAATRNLLHPSPKSQAGNTKSATASDAPASQKPAQGETTPATNLLTPPIPLIPSAALLQPATIAEARLQATTLSAEQNQSAAQIANTIAATGSSVSSGSQPSVPAGPQSEATSVSGTLPDVAGTQATAVGSAVPVPPQFQTPSPVVNPQPVKQPPSTGFDLLSAAGKKESVPATDLPHPASGPAGQPATPAHSTTLASPATPAPPQGAGSVAPPAPVAKAASSEHAASASDTKNQATPASSASAASDASVPQIPLQSVMPDINVIKQSTKPVESLQTAPLTANPDAAGTQLATEVSKKYTDSGGSGNAQSGAGKSSTSSSSSSSFASTSPSGQAFDNSAIPSTTSVDISASAPVAAAHAVATAPDAAVSAVKTSVPTGDAQHSPAAAATEADARVQAAATYANSLLHSARLVERAGQTELRVGIQTGEFGNVDIRTSMVKNQFSAQISVERGDLGKVLAAELPGLQSRLSEQKLPGANITLQNQSGGGGANSGQGSRQSQTMQQIMTPQSPPGELAPAFISMAEASASSERLDIHM